MATFTDSKGQTYELTLNTGNVERVRSLVLDDDGKSLDLLQMVDKGDFRSLKSVAVLVDVAYVLCLQQISETFDVETYDATHSWMYSELPSLKNESLAQKRRRWWAERIDGQALDSLADALMAAILDFTPARRRAAVEKIHEKEMEVERLAFQMASEKAEKLTEEAPDVIEKELEKALKDYTAGK